jgi:hypothetical protein
MSDVPPDALPAAEDVPNRESQGAGPEGLAGTLCVLPDTTRQLRVASLEQWMDLCA